MLVMQQRTYIAYEQYVVRAVLKSFSKLTFIRFNMDTMNSFKRALEPYRAQHAAEKQNKRQFLIFECFYDQQDSCSCPKALLKTANHKSVW